jgi:thioredoxin 1
MHEPSKFQEHKKEQKHGRNKPCFVISKSSCYNARTTNFELRFSMDLTADSFDATVLQAQNIVLVDFWAPWCGPCKVMSPIVDELAGEMDGVTIGKVNVDENSELARQFNVLSIPTFIVFKSGQVVEQFSGSMSKEALKAKLEGHVG